MIDLNLNQVKPIIEEALSEDIGSGDRTTNLVVPEEAKATGKIVVKEDGMICGLPVARLTFEAVDKRINFLALVSDGNRVKKGQSIATLEGPARGILTAERTALNFLQRLSGIATLTAKFVEKVSDFSVKILDTRKTTPNLRILEKYAVRCGGGYNHRLGLYDAILIKDNHLALSGSIKKAMERVKEKAPAGMTIEVETNTLDQVRKALEAGAHVVMLDNMDLETLRTAVKMVDEWNMHAYAAVTTEASGGITLENVAEVARTGVDSISIGALTHSAPALDISLEIFPPPAERQARLDSPRFGEAGSARQA